MVLWHRKPKQAMSLSFVSKSIQTVKDDGEFEEKEVENPTETTGSASLRGSSGLFDQLRKNKEQEEAEQEEFQKSITRGTLALNEDDAAHLDYLESTARQKRSAMQTETKLALEDFRMAQSERAKPKISPVSSDKILQSFESKKKISHVVVKKRKRRDRDIDLKEEETPSGEKKDTATKADDTTATNRRQQQATSLHRTPISTLLDGYSSSSDGED